ncbi:MSCRAMM family protein [Ferrimonas lipolytica]|uniref:Carboxypeptidase regulatory-like domain-containing protein n=1 Tax=Ferrimonas lipolytica TaxID=2724191 RepID=A0A6H1UGN5_9GAMM|nr:hypothetical protein [Ferrimonas lipolytica]QIZ77483.1 hypothetical protein HER31_11645 [Ferrimonas lipolytica]
MNRSSSAIILGCSLLALLLPSGSWASNDNAALKNSRLISALKRIQQSYENPSNKATDMGAQASGIPAGEELLLDVTVAQQLHSDIWGIKSNSGAMLSLQDFFDLLQIPIEIDLSSELVEGWYFNPNNRFKLTSNLTTGQRQVSINGVELPVNDDTFLLLDDELLVDANQLANWFGLDLAINYRQMSLTIESSQTLPFEQQLARRERSLSSKPNDTPSFTEADNSYQLLSAPVLDLQLQGNFSENYNNGYFSALGSHDLAFMNSQYYFSGSSESGLDNARFTLSNQSNHNDLLGPLQVSQYSIGDVSPVSHGINSSSGLSRGARISNRNNNQLTNTRKITLDGDIQPGWDIELYHNELLIDQQFSNQNGRYEFNDVSLRIGDNRFELVFYGPYGEIERKSKQVLVDIDSTTEQQWVYDFSAVELNSGLFDQFDNKNSSEQGLQLSSQLQRGLNQRWSVELGASYLDNSVGADQQSLSLGSNYALWDNWLLDGLYQWDDQNDNGYHFGIRGQRQQHSFSAYIEQYHRDNKQWGTEVSGQPAFGDSINLNYLLSWTDYQTSSSHQQLRQSLNWRIANIGYEHSLLWGKNDYSEDSLKGSFRSQFNRFGVFSQLTLDYSALPQWQLDKVKVDLSWPIIPYLSGDVEAFYKPQYDQYQVQTAFTWQQNSWYLNSYFRWDSVQEWSLGLLARISVGYDNKTDSVLLTKQSLANSGTVLVRVFEDSNLNGKYDEDELLVKNAKVKAPQSRRQGYTNDSGIATLTSMPLLRATDVVLDRDSLEDGFLIPTQPGVAVAPKRGQMVVLEIPLVEAAEIDGTIYLQKDPDKGDEPAAYAGLMLKDKQGQTVATTQAEYDGYYLFTDIIPGDYQVVVDPEYAQRQKLRTVEPATAALHQPGTVLAGLDMTLERKQTLTGYAAAIGTFKSLALMQSYWHLLQPRLVGFELNGFYSIDASGYQLNAALYQQENEADLVCRKLQQTGISCNVSLYQRDF